MRSGKRASGNFPRPEIRTTEFRQTLTITLVLMTFVSSTALVLYDKIDAAVYWQLWSNIVSACVGWFGARPPQRMGDKELK